VHSTYTSHPRDVSSFRNSRKPPFPLSLSLSLSFLLPPPLPPPSYAGTARGQRFVVNDAQIRLRARASVSLARRISLREMSPLPFFPISHSGDFLRGGTAGIAFSRTRRVIGNAGGAIPRVEATDSNTFAGFIRHQRQRQHRRWRWVALWNAPEKNIPEGRAQRGAHARERRSAFPDTERAPTRRHRHTCRSPWRGKYVAGPRGTYISARSSPVGPLMMIYGWLPRTASINLLISPL